MTNLQHPQPAEGTHHAVTLLRVQRLAEIALHRNALSPDLPMAIESLEAIEALARKALR